MKVDWLEIKQPYVAYWRHTFIRRIKKLKVKGWKEIISCKHLSKGNYIQYLLYKHDIVHLKAGNLIVIN